MTDYSCQTEILLLNILKLIKIQGFSRFFVRNPRLFLISKILEFSSFFCIKCQIPGFFSFLGKVATL